MQWKRYSYLDLDHTPELIRDLLNSREKLKPFVNIFPVDDAFSAYLTERSFPADRRKVLLEVLKEQYADIRSPQNEQSLAALEEDNGYTVVTGHQLNIFTGPAFFIYKLMHAVSLARHLNTAFPDIHCVPVYWMASEDHDFEEIRSLASFDEQLVWEREEAGAVGRYALTGLDQVLQQWKSVMRWEDTSPVYLRFKRYTEQSHLAAATRYLVNELFGREGMLVIDADHSKLKAIFAPIMTLEVDASAGEHYVKTSSDALHALGYKTQVNARSVNLFYLEDNRRVRIDRDGDSYKGVGTPRKWSHPALLRGIKEEPEKFSPNVILRPLYQETILPNLCYIGGAGELSYWLQLKALFDAADVPYPILMPRNGAVVLAAHQAKKIDKLGVRPDELLKREEDLIAGWMEHHASQDLELKTERQRHEELFREVVEKVAGVDTSLTGKAEASLARQLKEYDGLEKAMQKAWKKREEQSVRQLIQLRDAVLPGGNLQERVQNYFALEQMAGGELGAALMKSFDPVKPGLTFVWPD